MAADQFPLGGVARPAGGSQYLHRAELRREHLGQFQSVRHYRGDAGLHGAAGLVAERKDQGCAIGSRVTGMDDENRWGRAERLRLRPPLPLETRLAPSLLVIEDESHLHAGHAGAAQGHSHFRVRIVSEAFRGVSPLARHRLVYAAVDDLLKTDIHALAIEASPPKAHG